MSFWKEFVSAITGDSSKKVSRAGHDFRDDSGAREGKDRIDHAPKWAEPKTDSGIDYFPEGRGPK